MGNSMYGAKYLPTMGFVMMTLRKDNVLNSVFVLGSQIQKMVDFLMTFIVTLN